MPKPNKLNVDFSDMSPPTAKVPPRTFERNEKRGPGRPIGKRSNPAFRQYTVLLRIDTHTRKVKLVFLPGEQQPYHVTVDKNHDAWTNLWGADRVMRYDPNTGGWTAFDLPTRGSEPRYLSVHEGPASLSRAGRMVPLAEGMIISDEPGYYQPGEYGIRLENLLLVQSAGFSDANKPFLRFEVLTLAPFDRRLIDPERLDPGERAGIMPHAGAQKLACALRSAETATEEHLREDVTDAKLALQRDGGAEVVGR